MLASQSQPCHEKDTGYDVFKAIVKMKINWKRNANILKEIQMFQTGKIIILKYQSLCFDKPTCISHLATSSSCSVRKTTAEGQSGSIQSQFQYPTGLQFY